MSLDHRLTPEDVQRMAAAHSDAGLCGHCEPFASPGWESFPSTVSDAALSPLGALWLPGDDEPTLEEHRPVGVDQWSPHAPIALAYHPYNRCQVWGCRHCGQLFLRYTEYGGYYEDARIRQVTSAVIQTARNA